MSSAILYVAIVVIWIGVLVPRWLRHDHAREGHLRLHRFSRQRDAGQQADDRGARAGLIQDGVAQQAGTGQEAGMGEQASAGERADDPNARAGFIQDGEPRYTSFGVHGDPHGDRGEALRTSRIHGATPAECDYSLSQNYNAAYASVERNGDTGDMAQRYEMDEAPAPVRSYGWSAEEYLRQERTSQRDPHGQQYPAERQEQGHRGRRDPSRDDERPRHDERLQRESRRSQRGRSDGSGGAGRDHHERRPDDGDRRPVEYRAAADSERRARVVRGRRRMLWMLIALTAVGAGLAYLRLADWWIVIPPVVLLGGYLLLLREAAHADAEARERAATAARHAREAARRRARAEVGRTRSTSVPTGVVWDSSQTDPRAEIIDISERVGDQLYDQYADAKLRAVGD